MMRITNSVLLPRNVLIEYADCAADYAQVRYGIMCSGTSLKISQERRAIVFPTLRVTERRDDTMDALIIKIQAQTVPAEAA
jgi:hypothetical protein